MLSIENSWPFRSAWGKYFPLHQHDYIFFSGNIMYIRKREINQMAALSKAGIGRAGSIHGQGRLTERQWEQTAWRQVWGLSWLESSVRLKTTRIKTQQAQTRTVPNEIVKLEAQKYVRKHQSTLTLTTCNTHNLNPNPKYITPQGERTITT